MAACCAAVGGRLDPEALAHVDAALRAGQPSLGSLAATHDVSKTSLTRHKFGCLKITPTEGAAPLRVVTVPERSNPVPTGLSLTRDPPQPGVPAPFQASVQALPDAPSPLTESRIDTIADMVRMCLWRNRGTVLAMAARWGLPEREINRLHRTACRRLAAARGGPVAQREQSVAVCAKIRDEELAYAEKLQAEIERCLKPLDTDEEPDLRGARTRAVLAATARGTALSAQRQIDQWTQKDSITVTVSQAAPDAEVWGLVRTMLDAWAPGLADKIDEGLGVFEDRGKKGLDDFVAEVGADMGAMVVRGESVG